MQYPYLRVTVVVALIVVLAIYLMLKYTRFGRSIYAVGGNQQSATLMGLDVKKTQMKAYILSSFLTSIGGICYCLNTMAGTTTQATGLEMDAISSASYRRYPSYRWCGKCAWISVRSIDQRYYFYIS